MKKTIKLLKQIMETSSKLSKKKILAENVCNDKLCRLLFLTLNPRLTYKVSEKTLSSANSDGAEPFDGDFFQLCSVLSMAKAMDDRTLKSVRLFLDQVESVEEREVYSKILTKTLRLGMSAKSVNDVIPNYIPEWEVQQAYQVEKYPLKKNQWFALTQKLNGVRATYYKGALYGRSGTTFEGMEHILRDIPEAYKDDYVFDGELTLVNKENLTDNEAFRTATGIINSDSDNKTAICYTVFDALPASEFENGASTAPYSERRKMLDAIAAEEPVEGYVRVLRALYLGCELSKIDELLQQMVDEDKEGLMVNLDVPYKCKRHRGILKVKRFYTMDLPIIGFEQGTGRLSNTLGSLVVDFKGTEVGVGSGFTDEQRDFIWSHQDDFLGCLAEVKYKEVSVDKSSGKQSLQFPVIVQIRTDKEQVSYD